MLALTLYRPWSQCIVYGPKRIENRPWAPPAKVIGTTIAIHAGKKWDKDGEAFMRKHGFNPPMTVDEEPAMALVGTARVMLSFNLKVPASRQSAFTGFADVSAIIEDVRKSPWAFGPVCWVLEDVKALVKPVPCAGALGLWKIAPDLEEQMHVSV